MVERVVVGPWKTNCYIFSSSKKECVIIDPGGDEAEIAARVDVLSMVPIGIALTHGHVDHAAALGKLQASYAARGYKLPVAVSAADKKYIGIGGLDIQREILDQLGLDGKDLFATAEELPRADVRLHDGDRVFDTDIVVLETPGHTSGSVCFYSEKEGILFSGDTLYFDGVGRSDLPGGSEKKLRESILTKIAVLPPETRVFPGHGPFTTVERERRGNPFLREPQPVKPIAPLLARPMIETPRAGGVEPRPKGGVEPRPRSGSAPRVNPVNGAPSRVAVAEPRRAPKAAPVARRPHPTGQSKKASSARKVGTAPRAAVAKHGAGSHGAAAHPASKLAAAADRAAPPRTAAGRSSPTGPRALRAAPSPRAQSRDAGKPAAKSLKRSGAKAKPAVRAKKTSSATKRTRS